MQKNRKPLFVGMLILLVAVLAATAAESPTKGRDNAKAKATPSREERERRCEAS